MINTQPDEAAVATPGTKRQVWYLMGFDPRGSHFYHALLRREARLSQRRGYSELQFGALTSTHQDMLGCDYQSNAGVHGQYHFPELSDLILNHFRPSPGRGWFAVLFLLWNMLGRGLVFRNGLNHWPFNLFLMYPVVVMLLGLFAGIALINLLDQWWATPGLLQLLLYFGFLYLYDRLLRRLDGKLYVHYLLGDFMFSAALISKGSSVLEQRLQQWAVILTEQIKQQSPSEQFLLVGHSSGALLGIRLAAMVVGQLNPTQQQQLALLTLGNQASIGLSPIAQPLRDSVRQLCLYQTVCWRDIFAPQDVISSGKFDLCKRFAADLPTPQFRQLSARWREALTVATYQKLRFSYFKLHMQYLRSSETGDGFDYLQLLNSPRPLTDYQQQRSTEPANISLS